MGTPPTSAGELGMREEGGRVLPGTEHICMYIVHDTVPSCVGGGEGVGGHVMFMDDLVDPPSSEWMTLLPSQAPWWAARLRWQFL